MQLIDAGITFIYIVGIAHCPADHLNPQLSTAQLPIPISNSTDMSTNLNVLGSNVITKHIEHKFSKEMAKKSSTTILDVLQKSESDSSEMIEIMRYMQKLVAGHAERVLSGGDLVTTERQVAAQHHVIDGKSMDDQLLNLEPQVEDLHCVMNFICVSHPKSTCAVWYKGKVTQHTCFSSTAILSLGRFINDPAL